jgi:hypothetical protein
MVSNITKAHWNSDGDNLRLSMPFAKVDKERRIVSGFASLDNIDKQDDIVTAEASMDAFARFRGIQNLRSFILVFLFLHMFQRALKILGKKFLTEH